VPLAETLQVNAHVCPARISLTRTRAISMQLPKTVAGSFSVPSRFRASPEAAFTPPEALHAEGGALAADW
jgi:hypothetical protein